MNGRVLILDGLEKAERNVLPILNNLLENREMALEDGRFLLSPKRYQELIHSEDGKGANNKTINDNINNESGIPLGSKLVPVHPRFTVIALTTPAPPYPGKVDYSPYLQLAYHTASYIIPFVMLIWTY